MTDETRKALEAYCPEIEDINRRHNPDFRISEQERLILIAAAVRKAIIDKGEWEAFCLFAFGKYTAESHCDTMYLFRWLTDAETFCRVAGEWVKEREGR